MKGHDIKAVFFDIDGTLMSFTTRKIPDSALKARYTLKEKGIKLFIASGRPPIQLTLLGEQFNSFPWDGYALMNGQYCTDEKREMFYSLPVSKECLKVLVPWIKENADYPCTFMELDYSYDIRFNEGMYNYLKQIGRTEMMVPVDDQERCYTHDTYQVCPYVDASFDEEFLRHAPGLKCARWTPDFADMIPENGGKPEGMKQLMNKYGIRREECMAFGDGGNDITMLEYAGIGVAMGNAADHVKAAADYVTDHVDNDGLLKAFTHFGMI